MSPNWPRHMSYNVYSLLIAAAVVPLLFSISVCCFDIYHPQIFIIRSLLSPLFMPLPYQLTGTKLAGVFWLRCDWFSWKSSVQSESFQPWVWEVYWFQENILYCCMIVKYNIFVHNILRFTIIQILSFRCTQMLYFTENIHVLYFTMFCFRKAWGLIS